MKYQLALLLIAASGCLADLDYSTDESEVLSSNRISLNGLTLDRNLLGDVASGALTTTATRVPQLFTTAQGRDQFSYLVSCALRSDKTINVISGGVAYSFTGSIGLAGAWEKGALPDKEYAFISSCMLARTNFFGIAVAISLRGPDYATTSAEKSAFTVVEGAFWGNVFTPGTTMAACASPVKLSGSTISTLPLRECAVSEDGVTTKCGFRYAGDCSEVCDTDASGIYKNCEKDAKIATVFLAAPQ